MKGGSRAGTISSSDRPGVRALVNIHMKSVHSGESWTIYIKSQHACWPYLPSCRKANHFSLSDGFRPVSPSYGCDVTASITLSSPDSYFNRKSPLFFLRVRTLSEGACNRYRKYVQQ